eukprot:COSAG06_NODE_7_length_38054_cov_37.302569_32_plen_244_part_00
MVKGRARTAQRTALAAAAEGPVTRMEAESTPLAPPETVSPQEAVPERSIPTVLPGRVLQGGAAATGAAAVSPTTPPTGEAGAATKVASVQQAAEPAGTRTDDPELGLDVLQPAVQQCSICLLDVLPDQHRAAAHPDSGCPHEFHWACLADSLALVSSTCPNCRRPYHVNGVYEISPDGERRLHVPDERVRAGAAGAGEPIRTRADDYGAVGRFCQHRLALPTIITMLALPFVLTFWFGMTRDN